MATQVVLRCGDGLASTRPQLLRQDAADAFGVNPAVSFDLRLIPARLPNGVGSFFETENAIISANFRSQIATTIRVENIELFFVTEFLE